MVEGRREGFPSTPLDPYNLSLDAQQAYIKTWISDPNSRPPLLKWQPLIMRIPV